MTVVETKDLKMHNNLLLNVIQRQAGTLAKGVLEGVMNSIEAGATKVDIHLKTNEEGKHILSIYDDGAGIENLEDIERFFETFGTPHDESEHKVWARFRVGRGQLFSVGFNTWRTSGFQMKVDIKNWGLSYQLEKNLDYYNGCNIDIELYENPIGSYPYYSEEKFIEEIKKQVQFMSIPICFNGQQLNTPPEYCEWTFEDEFAYYHFGIGTNLTIYNLGAYVMDLSASSVGNTGVIVSKQQLKVNFARNDILSDCPIYQDIQQIITANRVKRSRAGGARMRDHERQAALIDIRDGVQSYRDTCNIGLIRTAMGRYVSLETIRKNRLPWVFAPAGSRIADKVTQTGTALCLDRDVLDELNFTGEEQNFFNWLVGYEKLYQREQMSRKVYSSWLKQPNLYITYDANAESNKKSLADFFEQGYEIIPQSKWNKVETRVLNILDNYNCWQGRVLRMGLSDEASAWTDGSTHITIDKNFLKGLKLEQPSGTTKLMTVLMHELAHDDDTEGSHIHGEEFYRHFHDIAMSGRPLGYLPRFCIEMKNAKIDEKTREIIAKENKAEADKNRKLGITALADASNDDSDDMPF